MHLTMDCLFCNMVNKKQQAHVVFEDSSHFAIMDRYPVQQGHALVMPKAHFEKITDMPSDAVAALFAKVPSIAKAILDATGADGFNIGQNNGRSANQIIPHVHVHIIPRYKKIGSTWARRTIPTDKELEDLASAIKSKIKSS